MISSKLAALFEAKFQKAEGCWRWQGAKLPRGYGVMYAEGKNQYAHRISYDLYVWPDFPKRLHVLHSCDNPSCVNPGHLFLGTDQENNDDCRSKGRNRIGESHPRAVLTDREMLEIRDLCLRGPYRSVDLARMYGCSPSGIAHIKAGYGRITQLLNLTSL